MRRRGFITLLSGATAFRIHFFSIAANGVHGPAGRRERQMPLSFLGGRKSVSG